MWRPREADFPPPNGTLGIPATVPPPVLVDSSAGWTMPGSLRRGLLVLTALAHRSIAQSVEVPCEDSYCSGIVIPIAQKDAETRAVQWATAIGHGSGDDEAEAIAANAAGSSFVTGSFSQTAMFGSEKLTAGGDRDAFVTMLSREGSVLWTMHPQCASGSLASGRGVAAGSSGGAFVTGRFKGEIDFGVTNFSSPSKYSAFVAQLTSTGRVAWAIKLGGTARASGEALAVDATGAAVYVTGDFAGTLALEASGLFQGTALTMVSSGRSDAFLVKLNGDTGLAIWAAKIGGPLDDVGRAIAVDASGDVLITGDFSNTTSFTHRAGGTFAGSTFSAVDSAGYDDAFIAKYDSAGQVQWAMRAGGDLFDGGSGVAVDAAGNVFVAGHFGGTANFGAWTLGDTPNFGGHTITAAGFRDVFVAKFKSTGILEWSLGGGCDNRAATMCDFLACDSNLGSCDCSSAQPGTCCTGCGSTLGCSVGFVDDSRSKNNLCQAVGSGIAVDASGDAFVTGTFEGVLNIGNRSVVTRGADDVYVLKVSEGRVVWAMSMGSDSGDDRTPDRAAGVAVGGSGDVLVAGSHYNVGHYGAYTLRSESRDAEAFVLRMRGECQDRTLNRTSIAGCTPFVPTPFPLPSTSDSSATSPPSAPPSLLPPLPSLPSPSLPPPKPSKPLPSLQGLQPPSLLPPPLPPLASPLASQGNSLSDSTSQELSTGAVAGIAVGAIVTTLLLLVVGIYVLKKERASTMVKTLKTTASQEETRGMEMGQTAAAASTLAKI